MQLEHQSKAGELKACLPLDALHDELRINSSAITGAGGASNIVLAKVSFDVLIKNFDESKKREFITFDLKIPGGEDALTSDYIINVLYGNAITYFKTLKFLYHRGRRLANPDNHMHGTLPDYDPDNPSHHQYILHTEQLLTAYLAHPAASKMLVNRLRAQIRGTHPEAAMTKVYKMTLHMHSTKTCCAPCEYVLLGLMDLQETVRYRNIAAGIIFRFGFHNFFRMQCALPNELLTFILPKKIFIPAICGRYCG